MFGSFKFKDYPETTRLALMLALFFALPLITLGYLGFVAINTVRSEFDSELTVASKRAADTVDRNLFERYGDVQAFGLNAAVQDRSQWYLEGDSVLRSAMNAYVDTYDLYYLTILVDTEGKVIAVNDKDASGKSIDTKFLHGQSLADTAWFQALRSGQYTTKQKYTSTGNDQVTGTFMEDAHVDPHVRRAYGNGDALTLGFSAPVKDAQGKTIAYWSNRATFKIVTDIVEATQSRMAAVGRPHASVSVFRIDGSPLVTITPEGDKPFAEPDLRNLAHGVDEWLGADVAGHGVFHASGEAQIGGASRLTGVLGYPGMPWSVAVTVPESNPGSSFAELSSNQRNAAIGLSILALPLALILLRSRKRGEDAAREQLAREAGQKDEVRRIQSVVDFAPNPTIILDNDFKIVYVNTATTQALSRMEAYLPCRATELVGQTVDIFHKNPAPIRALIADPKRLPHRADVKLGPETLRLFVYALFDNQGRRSGSTLAWEVVTERVAMEERDNKARHAVKVVQEALEKVAAGDINVFINEKFEGDLDIMRNNVNRITTVLGQFTRELSTLSAAAAEGDLRVRANASEFRGAYADIIGGVNAIVEAVVAPIETIRQSLSKMAEGDLTSYVNENYRGDHGALKDALNQTLDGLNSLLGKVNGAAGQITSSSQQVASAAQDLSQGASEQAATIEEISAQMAQITGQTQQNAENAAQANQLALAARDGASVGDKRMNEMLVAMGEIEDSSNSISKIIKVIDEIAFQTNLLALNAAVEAARAGVHGKGFAVVAEEVRNLAARSARAAKETTEMIEGSIKKVALGTEIARETASALGAIVGDVGKVTDLVAEIAAASSEQAEGINQINVGLDQVNQVTQRNTATAEQSAASAEEMSGQMGELQRMVGSFRLGQVSGGGFGGGGGLSDEMIRQIQGYMARMANNDNSSPAAPAPKAAGGMRRAQGGGSRAAADVINLGSSEFGKY
jgi:methyl-accepting chemotaxis protein